MKTRTSMLVVAVVVVSFLLAAVHDAGGWKPVLAIVAAALLFVFLVCYRPSCIFQRWTVVQGKSGRWGIYHPTRWHVWDEDRFATRAEAQREADLLNEIDGGG
jgi:hypothetical protein